MGVPDGDEGSHEPNAATGAGGSSRTPVLAVRIEQELGEKWWTDPDAALDDYIEWFTAQNDWL